MTVLTHLSSLKPLRGLVLLIGPPGSGKSTFARKLIEQHIIEQGAYISNDKIARDLFGVDVERGDKDGAIFAEQDERIASLLRANKAAVVDATNVRPEARERLIAISKQFAASVTAFCFWRDTETLLRQNKGRGVEVPEDMVREYALLMQQTTVKELQNEGIEKVYEVAADIG